MMRRYHIALIAIVGLCLIPVGIATSAQSEDRDEGRDAEEIVIITGDGEHLSMTVEEGPRLRVVKDGEDEEVIEIDLSDIGEVIRDALASVDEAMDEIADVQIDMRLGRKNSLTIFDGEDEVMVDVGEIMSEVGHALQEAFAELEEELADELHDIRSDDRRRRRHHVESEFNDRDEEQLRRQLRNLKDEIAELKAELRRLERRQNH